MSRGITVIAICFVFFISIALAFNFTVNTGKRFSEFSQLAESFTKGRLDLPVSTISEEKIPYGGKFYWHEGPFPAVFLMPFVYVSEKLGLYFYQGYLQFLLVFATLYLCFRLARLFKYSREDALYLAFAFCFASVYQAVGVFPFSWYFSQVVCVFFCILALYEFFNKKRFWLIGVFMAAVFASRITAGLGVVFFLIEILTDRKKDLAGKLKSAISLLLPLAVTVLFIAFYNYSRFGSFLENGYFLTTHDELQMANNTMFNVDNISLNIFLYFINLPKLYFMKLGGLSFMVPGLEIDSPSISFFIVSPIFLFLAKNRLKTKVEKSLLITSFLILIILLSYYWSGWIQIGPRYTLDLLPFLYVLLLYSFKNFRIGRFVKELVIISSLFDFYLLLTVFL